MRVVCERSGDEGTRDFYTALGLIWRFSREMNFDYPALNLPGGFFDGRIVMQASQIGQFLGPLALAAA
jgi:hypothetical protein